MEITKKNHQWFRELVKRLEKKKNVTQVHVLDLDKQQLLVKLADNTYRRFSGLKYNYGWTETTLHEAKQSCEAYYFPQLAEKL